jgi:uncharacterized damage-inducible protein DinB
MDLLDHYRLMARYNAWMNGNLYKAAALLCDEERKRDRGAFFKSIHGTLNHLLVGDSLWMARFEGQAFEWRGHGHEMHAEFDALRRARVAMDARIADFTARLQPAWLDSPFAYAKTSGARVSVHGYAALTHFFNHQTHHRGQVTTLLMQAGIDPGETDIVAMPGVQQT